MHAGRVDGRRKAERRVVGQRQRAVEVRHPVETGDWTKELGTGDRGAGRGTLQERRRDIVPTSVPGTGQPMPTSEHGGTFSPGFLYGRKHPVELFLVDDRPVVVVVAGADRQ